MPSTIQTSASHGLLACPECEAALESAQRYCVHCGARNQAADSPAARYFASAAQRRRAPVVAPRRRGVGLGSAALLAILPLAIGVGVLVGRSSDDGGLADALRKQQPTVVNVGGGVGGAGTGTIAAAAAAPKPTDAKAKNAKASAEAKRKSDAVVATGVAGAAHSVVHHQSTAASRGRDKAVVRRLNKQTGKSYVDSQRNLPDVIEVQKDPNAGPSTPQAPGQP